MQKDELRDYRAIIQVVKNVVFDFVKKNPSYNSMVNDLIQEGMLKAMEVIDKFDPSKGASIETFVSRCVRNEIINKVKGEYAKSRILEFIKDSDIPDEKYSNIDLSLLEAQISNFIETNDLLFSEEDREIVNLRMMGCKYEEIAKRIGKNKKYVDNSIQRIKKIILEKFKL
ncbi:MAG: sigma-70 family RNA polymerase sigma factor [Brevinematia bacterium]